MNEPAQVYRSLGWATLRVPPCSKAPIDRDWPKRDYPPEAFAPEDNVGIKLGDPSGGLVDLDLDCPESIALAPLFLPPTATFGRPSKPRSHWIYQCQGVRTRKPASTHVELRSTGGQTVFPGSIHESGEVIAWQDWPVVSISEHDLLTAFGRLCAAVVVARMWPEIEGDRHNACLMLAGCLWHAGWSEGDASSVLLPSMEVHGGPSSDHPHRQSAIASTWEPGEKNRYGWPTLVGWQPIHGKAFQKAVETVPSAPRVSDSVEHSRPLTDAGNAERFVDDYGADLRHAQGLGWLQWDGIRWDPLGVKVEPVELAIASARRLQRQGIESGDSKAAKWGIQGESQGKLQATLAIAKSLTGIAVPVSSFDADPGLMCARNGVVDLRTATIREPQQTDLITKVAAATYDPAAQCPRFVRFLGEIFCGDWTLASYVLRYIGYAMTGWTHEQVFQLWYGTGANGKSTLLDTVQEILGDYAQTMASDMLMERRQPRDSGGPSPDIARMRGVRLAAGVETKDGQRWNESLVKQLTGGDAIVARHLHQSPIEFRNEAKLILAVNHKPVVRGMDHGMWRRIHLVPFEARFDEKTADKSLGWQLRQEAPGIFALLVAHCVEWQRIGLDPPARVLAEVDAYRKGQDVVGAFLEECCEIDGTQTTGRGDLYNAYRMWAAQSGEYCHGKHAFNNALRERGYEEKKSGGMVWCGIKLVVKGF